MHGTEASKQGVVDVLNRGTWVDMMGTEASKQGVVRVPYSRHINNSYYKTSHRFTQVGRVP